MQVHANEVSNVTKPERVVNPKRRKSPGRPTALSLARSPWELTPEALAFAMLARGLSLLLSVGCLEFHSRLP